MPVVEHREGEECDGREDQEWKWEGGGRNQAGQDHKYCLKPRTLAGSSSQQLSGPDLLFQICAVPAGG